MDVPHETTYGGADSRAESRHARELRLLQEISETVDRTIDLRTVTEPILESIARNLGCERSIITLLARDGESIWIDASRGLTPEQASHGRYRLGEGVVGRVIQSGEPLVVSNTAESSVFLNRTGSGRDPNTAFICVPIREQEKALGALAVYRPAGPGGELAETARILQIAASMIARALLLRRDLQDAHESLVAENRRLRAELVRKTPPQGIIGSSPAMQRVYAEIGKVAPTGATVLILGGTGTGKELVARAIHDASPRAAGPFVAVHCAALPESLIESELFGHVKGAFTGAESEHKGRFGMAHGGTLFLDEAGEIPLSVQAKLLRVIQERAFVPVGGEHPMESDVRIIAATHRDLAGMCAEGRFREDLYYRLNVFPIRLPPLSERGNDILLLADHFIEKYSKEWNRRPPRLAPESADLLLRHTWPGNVRELENCIERALLLAQDGEIAPATLPEGLRPPAALPQTDGGVPPEGTTLDAAVAAVERAMIARALEKTKGNTAAAARLLSTTSRIISYKARKHGIAVRRA